MKKIIFLNSPIEIVKYYFSKNESNYNDYIRELFQKATSNSQDEEQFQLELAYIFIEGEVTEKNDLLAENLLKLSAEHGNEFAQYQLALFYETRRANHDKEKLITELYSKAACQGHADAQYALAEKYYRMQNGIEDIKKAAYWYLKSALQYHDKAVSVLLSLIEHDQPLFDDTNESIDMLREMASRNFPIAQLNLAIILYNINKISVDEVNKLLCILGKNKNSKLINRLSNIYYSLGISEHDELEVTGGEFWFEEARKLKNSDANIILGNIKYNEGKKLFAKKQYKEAENLFYEAGYIYNNVDAFYDLALMYASGTSVEVDIDKDIIWLRKESDDGNEDASFILGEIYNISVFNNNAEANVKDEDNDGENGGGEDKFPLFWYRRAANQGHDNASYRVALLLEPNFEKLPLFIGDYDEEALEFLFDAAYIYDNQDAKYKVSLIWAELGYYENYSDTVIDWLINFAESGDKNSQYYLGDIYSKGEVVGVNYHNAIEWFKKASEQDCPRSAFRVAQLYDFFKDYDSAFLWYLRAAELGNDDSAYIVASRLAKGKGTDQDYFKAAVWFEKSASSGESSAMYNLGVMSYNGQGLEQCYKTAINWFKAASDLGNCDAMYSLGLMHEQGVGISTNYVEAVYWFEKAGEYNHINSLVLLGELYEKGEKVSKSLKQSEIYFRKAASLGDDESRKKLVKIYQTNNILPITDHTVDAWFLDFAKAGPVDFQYRIAIFFAKNQPFQNCEGEALTWLMLAASNCHVNAQYELGCCYISGKNIDKDYEKALDMLNKSADQGSAAALYKLGQLYEFGEGVVQDDIKAKKLYQKAASQGHADATSRFNFLKDTRRRSGFVLKIEDND